jgi:hypothetical protein
MVIRKGQDWGEPGSLPIDAPIASTNSELRAAVVAGANIVGVTGGDLCRTLGGDGTLSMSFPIDICRLQSEGIDELFVSHCVVKRSWWWGPIVVACNVEHIGAWDVAPRAHPNDGLLDVLEVTMSFADRVKAFRRLRLGTHVPHPGIKQRRVTTTDFSFPRPVPVWLDGERIKPLQTFTVTIIPDALTIVF